MPKPTARSRVTNGKRLHAGGVDGRSRQARRWRDHFRSYLAQTGGRHPDLCRALASLLVQRELLDARLASGESVDPLELVRVVGAIGRVMAQAGIVADDDDAREPYDATEEAIARLEALP